MGATGSPVKSWKFPLTIRTFLVFFAAVCVFGFAAIYMDSSFILPRDVKVPSVEEYEFSRSDPLKVIVGINYAKCKSLSSVEKDVKEDLDYRIEVAQKYKQLQRDNQLFCGTSRLSKRSLTYLFKHTLLGIPYHAKEYDCVPKLTDAKRDIYHYMKSLCSSQEDANTDREKVSLASLESSERRGVIYTGGVNHLMKIYESIYGMMLLNISLPVEVWVNAEDQYFCARIIGRLARESERTDILCRTLSYSTMPQSKSSHMGISLRKSFMCKFLALLSTSFTDVIFIDADNLPVTAKVAGIFDSEEYKSTGAVIWPDIFGENCRETAVREKVVDPGITAWSSHCAWQAHMGGLSWYNQFKFAQEAETGQIALNLRRHGALIEFATVLMEHDFFRTVFYGDKDLFRFVFLLMEEPFYFVPQYPALSVYTPEPNSASSLRVDSLVQFFPSISASSAMAGSDASTRTPADFEPFFFHQLKLRNPEAFRRVLQVPAEVNTHPSACIQSSDCEIELPSHVSSASYAVGTSSGADTVNRTNQDIVVPARRLRTDYTLVESPASTRGYDSSPRNLASSLEKLHLRNLEKGDDYAHFAEKVFRKGDEEWKLINSTWFRFALILHKMYGIFQAIYYQLASFL